MAKEFDNEFYEYLKDHTVDVGAVPVTETISSKQISEMEQQLLRALEEAESSPVVDPKVVRDLKKQLAKVKRLITQEQNARGVGDFDIKHSNYDELLARREEIKLSLEEIANSAVIDMLKKEKLEKELKEVEAAIIAIEQLDDKEVKEDKDEHEKDQQDEQEKDEKDLNETKTKEEIAKEAALKQAYYDAMIAYYALRERNHIKTKNSGDRLVSSSDDYLAEIKAEDNMYKARDAYLKLGKNDPFEAARQELREQERRMQQEMMANLNKKVAEYRKLEIELAKLDKMREEKEEEIEKAISGGATQNKLQELNEELKEIDIKRKKTKEEIVIRKDKLKDAMDTLMLRKGRRRELDLESREYAAQSIEEKNNIRYLETIEEKRTNDYTQASKLENQNIRAEVERNEDRYEKLKKELKEVNKKEPYNFEKKLAILEQMDDASQQLKASREVQKDVERGIEPDTDKAIKESEKIYKSQEEGKTEFRKEAEELIAAAKEQEAREGKDTVEDPTNDSAKVREQKGQAVVMATMGAMAIESPGGDGPARDLMQAGVLYEAVKPEENIPPSPILGLGQEQVKVIDDTPDGRKNAEETIRMAEEAEKNAQDIQRDIEDRVQ